MSREHTSTLFRLAIALRGAVQGVGFRPFVYTLALEMRLNGWVSNTTQGVFIEAEGSKEHLDRFLLRLQKEIPPRASIQSLEFSFLDPVGFRLFEIRESISTGGKTTLILPDIATCSDCLKELFNPLDRRYLYPFTNCTHCGPRFSLLEGLPYDRANTSMKKFEMCFACRREYENPLDRRFHAQPNACPECGPQLQAWDTNGKRIADQHEALLCAVQTILEGKVAAVKGLGGFHLIVDARNEGAVRRLRELKHREEKPLALMFPSLEDVKKECEVLELEERLLLSPESPIVLLRRIQKSGNSRQNENSIKTSHDNFPSSISTSVAPHNPYLGCMLPYTPLHHVLMRKLGFPVVATSGNISDEPICTDEYDALQRLVGIADMYLVHNRPIVRHIDDSIVRVMMGRELVIRRARGYAPLPINVATQQNMSLLAVGAQLKNTIALTSDSNVFISQHIGDLETQQSLDAFHRVITDFQTLYECTPTSIACDLHPDYLSSQFARGLGIPLIEVQHHYAHIASCMAENQIDGEVLGVSWDGTGYGSDGILWGGEFLLTTKESFTRVGTFRPFLLPGGEKAIKEPRRAALGLLFELFGEREVQLQEVPPLHAFTHAELELIIQMLIKKVNAPVTTSVGRLFDAVASILGVQQQVNFEGQAAMELEFLSTQSHTEESYACTIGDGRMHMKNNSSALEHTLPLKIIDWSPCIHGILEDVCHKISSSMIATKFHNTLVESIVAIAKIIGQPRVVLSGGCFQNRYLTEHAVERLQKEGFRPYWHQRVPPNDGGISLGQVYASFRLQNPKRA